jgi:hypothetical protein
MRKPLFIVPALLLLFAASGAEAKTDIEFVLDASGSMRAAMGGSTQMEIAKQTIKSTIATIPPETHVALRVYAHRIEQSDKAGSCVDTELMIPFGPLNVAAVSAKVDSIQPKGYTPIAYSLQQVASDFGLDREAEKVVILVSDGEETCGGDPVQAVKDLIAKGFKLKLHAVGFNVDPKTQAQLQAIAAAGGGQYYDARDGGGLSGALQKITQEALVIQKTTATYGSEIKGGDSYETAVAIPALAQEFRLNHHQRVNQFDYFYVDLKAGQQLSVTLNTVLKGVSIDAATSVAKESQNAYAGFQLHDSTRTKLKDAEIIGSANATKTLSAYAPAAGRYYVLIGSTYADQHKDHPFKVEVKDLFDAGSGSDAPGTIDGAVAIEKGKPYKENYFVVQKDETDFFKVATAKGETITVQALPESLEAVIEITLFDELRVQLGQARSPNKGAGVRVTGTATGGVIYAQVQLHYLGDVDTKYSLTVEGGAMAPVTAEGLPPPAAPSAAPTPPEAPTQPPPVATPPPAAEKTVEKIVEKVVEKPADFKWFSVRGLKGLGISFGAGLLGGLIGGFTLFGKKKQAS